MCYDGGVVVNGEEGGRSLGLETKWRVVDNEEEGGRGEEMERKERGAWT